MASDIWGEILFWAVPTFFVSMGGVALTRPGLFYRRAASTTFAGVVGFEGVVSSDGVTLYRPVVRCAAEGRDRVVADSLATRPPVHAVGAQVRVHYPPGRPGQAQGGRGRYVTPLAALFAVG